MCCTFEAGAEPECPSTSATATAELSQQEGEEGEINQTGTETLAGHYIEWEGLVNLSCE